MPRKRLNLPMQNIVQEYDAGSSVNSLAKKYKVSNRTLASRLKEEGREIRPTKGGRPKKHIFEEKIETLKQTLEETKPKRRIGW